MTKFTVVNHANSTVRVEESRADAEDRKQLGITDLGIAEENIDIVQGAFEDYAEVTEALEGADAATATDGGPEVVESTASPEPTDGATPEVVAEKLPDEKPSVDTDPLTWMPSEFTDTIDGTVAINRKGYEVMAHHYGIGTSSTCEVGPEETGFEYARVHATATTEDGVTYEAQGSAHVERGDDMELLLEMADTRARKRAVAQATGVGMIAVEELQNEL